MRSRRVAAASLVLSAAVLVGVPAAYASRSGAPLTESAPSAVASPTPSTPAASTPAAAVPSPAPSRDAATAQPTRLIIPSVGVDAPVDPVGVAPDGQAEVPRDGRRVGWYRFGPAPGAATGSAVLIGHRDTRAQGPGELFDLGRVAIGAEVTVQRAGRSPIAYRVVERRLYSKASVPLDLLFARDGAPRLTVISCGGRYLPSAGGYQDNLVVVAVPVLGGTP